MMLRNRLLIAIIPGFYQLAQQPWPWLKGLILIFQWSQGQKHGFIYNGKENYKLYYWWQQYSFKYLRLNVTLLLLLAGTYKPFSFYGAHRRESTPQSQAEAISNRCIIERQRVSRAWYHPPAPAFASWLLHHPPAPANQYVWPVRSDWQGACCGSFHNALAIIFAWSSSLSPVGRLWHQNAAKVNSLHGTVL